MKCKYCGNEMKLVDLDYNFKGNKDNYWLCDCGGCAIEKVRFNKTVYYNFKKISNMPISCIYHLLYLLLNL